MRREKAGMKKRQAQIVTDCSGRSDLPAGRSLWGRFAEGQLRSPKTAVGSRGEDVGRGFGVHKSRCGTSCQRCLARRASSCSREEVDCWPPHESDAFHLATVAAGTSTYRLHRHARGPFGDSAPPILFPIIPSLPRRRRERFASRFATIASRL